MIRTDEAETSDEKQGGKQSTGRRERDLPERVTWMSERETDRQSDRQTHTDRKETEGDVLTLCRQIAAVMFELYEPCFM